MADVVKLLGGLSQRIDNIEKRKDKEEPEDLAADEDEDEDDKSAKQRKDAARADAAVSDYRNADRFAAFQARADSVASLFNQRAARPLSGETLGSYKRRTVLPWQSLSPTYKDVDLKVLSKADSVAFNVAIDDVLKCADAEGRRPTRVPQGFLAERVVSKNGHTTTSFLASRHLG